MLIPKRLTGPFSVYCLLQLGLAKLKTESEECNQGWFGKDCKYQCHCTTAGCGSSGECLGTSRCRDGFFGPGCQYWNVLYSEPGKRIPDYLRDQDDSTCNEDETATSVMVFLEKVIRFSWFRLHVNDGSKLNKFSLTFGTGVKCRNQRNFTVSKTSLDVTCDEIFNMTSLTLVGDVAPHVCSIYISGGRNVALKEEITETAATDVTQKQLSAKHAVDGDRAKCYSALMLVNRSAITITLTVPSVLTRLIIFNANAPAQQTQEFTVENFDSNDRLLDVFKVRLISPQPVYENTLNSSQPVKSIIITKTDYSDKGYFTLCEVQAFSDRVCPEDTFGLSCGRRCSCSEVGYCNTITGSCGFACPIGLYGKNCSGTCSPKCGKNPCKTESGECFECPGGNTGEVCTTVCPPKTYGLSCASDCPVNCLNGTCHPVSGKCSSCIEGYLGANCDIKCRQGSYGKNCSKACSPYCFRHTCDPVNGTCHKCINSRRGPKCEECPPGSYGAKCSSKCSDYCADKTCHHETGTCQSCTHGHVKPTCEDCPEGMYGRNCSQNCPQHCEGQCSPIYGYCHACTHNRTRPFCEACPRKYFGPNCTFECPENCRRGICHAVLGTCPKCIPGYTGEKCDKRQPMGFLLIILSLMILPFVIVYCCRKRQD